VRISTYDSGTHPKQVSAYSTWIPDSAGVVRRLGRIWLEEGCRVARHCRRDIQELLHASATNCQIHLVRLTPGLDAISVGSPDSVFESSVIYRRIPESSWELSLKSRPRSWSGAGTAAHPQVRNCTFRTSTWDGESAQEFRQGIESCSSSGNGRVVDLTCQNAPWWVMLITPKSSILGGALEVTWRFWCLRCNQFTVLCTSECQVQHSRVVVLFPLGLDLGPITLICSGTARSLLFSCP